jgi:hypothetical protein
MAAQFPDRIHIHTSGGGGGVFGYIVIGLLILGVIIFVIAVALKVSKMRREEAARLQAGLPPNPDFPMTPQQVAHYQAQQQPQQNWGQQQGFGQQAQQGYGYPGSGPQPMQGQPQQYPQGQYPQPGPGAGPQAR